MRKNEEKNITLDGLIKDLQVFLALSFREDKTLLTEWISETIYEIEEHCWEKNQCQEENCPAYKNESGRCWLIAGTMCGGKAQGKFVEKYGFCTECDFYKEVIGDDQVRRLRELIFALIHSLRLKQADLQEALSKVKLLSGFLPICASCKKIRDDQGYWYQIETYIREHSEAEFSHGICPECSQKYYDELNSISKK